MTLNKQVQVGSEDIKKLTENSKWKSREEEMIMRKMCPSNCFKQKW